MGSLAHDRPIPAWMADGSRYPPLNRGFCQANRICPIQGRHAATSFGNGFIHPRINPRICGELPVR